MAWLSSLLSYPQHSPPPSSGIHSHWPGCHGRRTESLSGSQATQGAMGREGTRDVSGRWQHPIRLSPLAVLPAQLSTATAVGPLLPRKLLLGAGRPVLGLVSLPSSSLSCRLRPMGACISAPPTPGAAIDGTGRVKTGISAAAGNMVPTSHALSKCYQDSQGHSQAEA